VSNSVATQGWWTRADIADMAGVTTQWVSSSVYFARRNGWPEGGIPRPDREGGRLLWEAGRADVLAWIEKRTAPAPGGSLTVTEVAARFGVSPKMVYKWVGAGCPNTKAFGRNGPQSYFDPDAVEAWRSKRARVPGRVNAPELADAHDVTAETVAQWVGHGCPHLRARGRNWFDPAAVDAWLAARPEPGGQPEGTVGAAGLAEALGVPVYRVWAWNQAGVPRTSLGNRQASYYDVEAVRAWLASREQREGAPVPA